MTRGRGQAETVTERGQAWMVDPAHDAIVGMNPAGYITSCNPAAARLYDYPAEQLVGRPAETLIPPERWAAEAQLLRNVLAGEGVEPYRADRICRNGTVVAVFVTISPIVDAAGAVVGATSMARRSSLQDARDRFEARVNKQRTDALDAADRFEVRVNHEREEMRDAADRFERRVAAERALTLDAEDRFQDGIDADRRQAQNSQDLLRGQLLQSQRLEVLGQLADGVAHDLNNLLAVILNHAAFVTEELGLGPGADLAAAGRDVALIERATQRAIALTHQLVSFARREVVQPRVLDLNHVVTDVNDLLRRTIGEDVMLRTELADDLWTVLADPGHIEQVLAHLAVNARDAMGGGGTLTIDTANIALDVDDVPAGWPVRAGRHVRLRVSDTGTGMSAEVAEHAFEPFFTTKAAGTGLGLGTVHGIVTNANGSISVESQPGLGTTVTIVIPATDELAVPVEDAPTHRTPKGELVLVVEDEESLRHVTERIFTRSGYSVITAADGPEAIALAAEHDGAIHLLVTDIVMPTMLGKDVVEKIREVQPAIEVLYMSGYARPVLAARGRLDPDVNLIEKPFSAAALIDRAGQILDGHVQGYETVATADAAPSG